MANSWEEVVSGAQGAGLGFTWDDVLRQLEEGPGDRQKNYFYGPDGGDWAVNYDPQTNRPAGIYRADATGKKMEGFMPGEGGTLTPNSYDISTNFMYKLMNPDTLAMLAAAAVGGGIASGWGGMGAGAGTPGWVSGGDLALGGAGLGEGAGALAASAPGWVSGSELALGNAGLGEVAGLSALPTGGMSATGTLSSLGTMTPEATLAAQIQAAGLAGTELGVTGTGLGGLAGLTGAPTVLGAGALAAAGGATGGAGGLSGLLSSLTGGTGGAGSLLGSLGGLAGNLYGLSQAGNVAGASDPWGTSGNRALSGEKLMALLSNPGSVSSTPGYGATMAASEQALTRNLASQGFTGSGLSAQALATFGGQFQNQAYKEQVQTLAGLAGAGGVSSPGAGQQSAYNNLGTNLAGLGSSLGQLVQSPAWSSGLASLSSLWG